MAGGLDRCDAPLCDRPVRPGCSLCEAHQKRKERGRYSASRIRELHLPPDEALSVAAVAYAEVSADDDKAWRRARRRLQLAALAFAAETLSKRG